ncbi:Uncharacterised protein [Slackia heliotrinireducens]|uniref:Phage head-tail adaptor, putative, SPP1 family n=1 Tax=Slackia heliotrinireducens (strain ATCC 29202 / DSM 20476 / NCTC 11029 / RHS 1) TaxID=471855 RepID=C7N4N9_SLAHD|nr:hypothetical protein [Slackia heliotrinireducens]ACV21874.1 hypothetical protein Shel_08180 [Slackia heliotrinireducens DSM 20476]VEG99645.1 Uncharacterised protein [Slackia heliotrinireducens]
MPKHLKDTKIGYWKIGEGYVDSMGVPHEGAPYKVADLWANFKGESFEEYYAAHAVWAEPVFVATFTRPDFEIRLHDYVYHDGGYYEIKAINDLTGHPHSDVKVTVQYDTNQQSQFADAGQ